MIRQLLTLLLISALMPVAGAQEPGAGYTPLIGKEHQALAYTHKDFTGKDWKACKAVCEADRRCQAFSFFTPNTGGARCTLRPQAGFTSTAMGTISGVRETPVPELTPEQKFARSERAKRSSEEVIDLYAPRMKPRKLTTAEKAEASALLARIYDDPVWPDVERLMVLAESGDRDAMLNLLKALKGKPDGSQSSAIWFTPWESWYGTPQTGIAARWAAEYWQRHGADRVAMGFLINAESREAGHVLQYGVSVPRDQKLLSKMWDYYWGKSKKAPKLKITIGHAYDGEAALRAKYDRLIAGRQNGTETHPIVKDWTEAYAQAHPEAAEALAAARSAEAQRELDEINRQKAYAAAMREQSQRVWNELSIKSDLTWDEQLKLEAHVGNLGDDYLEAFAARYPISYDSSAKRLCALGNPACAQARASVEFARQLQEAEYAKNAQLNAQAAGSGSSTYTLPFVEVRTYDRSGNYVGTQTMTRMQADIIGARP